MIRKKNVKKERKKNRTSCNLILKNFALKIHLYIRTHNIHVDREIRRVIPSYTPTYSQYWSDC